MVINYKAAVILTMIQAAGRSVVACRDDSVVFRNHTSHVQSGTRRSLRYLFSNIQEVIAPRDPSHTSPS